MKRLNQVPAANWDLALPNGQYTVRLVMGDPSFQDQTNHIKIEGVTYTDTDPYDDDQDVDAFGDFDEVTRTVTITDGKLTLSPSSGCYNTKLVFIEVTPLSGGGGTATPGLAAATYKYDALGRRLQKTVGAVATTFVHDGDQVVAEYEGSTLKRRYIYGTYIDEPLARVTSAGTQYYHQNRIYSVMALSNQSGQLAERYGYTPYGKRRVVSPGGATLAASAVGNQVGFTGRYHDGETGLTYFRARYQDAELGRFVGRDQLANADFRAGWFPRTLPPTAVLGMQARQLYGFAKQRPATLVDPSGLYADVVVNGNQVTITIPIDFAGPGATDAAVSNFTTAIEQGWSGQFGEYQVTTNVVQGYENQVEITSGDGRAYTKDGVYVTLPEARPPESAVHEAGHLLGLPDTYGNSSADDIMNRLASLPNAQAILDILKGNSQVAPRCGR